MRFTPNLGLGSDGKIKGADQASAEKEGLGNLIYKSGNYRAIKGVPAVWFKGELKGNLVYMLCLYSPTDNLVMLANLQGAKDISEADSIWDDFVASFEIK